jgi:predicted aspartyl protease
MTDMGSFRVNVEVENPARPGERGLVPAALVDTGAELSWFPSDLLESLGISRVHRTRFRQATGEVVERWTGVAVVHAAGRSAGDQVVFGEPGDLFLLGSRSLEGLNLAVDPVNKRLIDAGAMPAASGLAA